MEVDELRAASLFKQACDGGELAGCSNLGFTYFEGRGVAKDNVRAAAFFKKACDGGELAACLNLGVIYENGEWTMPAAL